MMETTVKNENEIFDEIKEGNIARVKEIISNSTDVNSMHPITKMTPLMLACKRGEVEVIKLLLEKDRNLLGKSLPSTNSPLYQSRGNEKLFLLLFNYASASWASLQQNRAITTVTVSLAIELYYAIKYATEVSCILPRQLYEPVMLQCQTFISASEKVVSKNFKPIFFITIGEAHLREKNFEAARYYYSKMMENLTSSLPVKEQIHCLFRFANFLKQTKDYPEATKIYLRGYEFSQQNSDVINSANFAMYISQCIIYQFDDIDLAMKYINIAESIAEKNHLTLPYIYYYKSWCHYYFNDLPNCIEMGNKFLALGDPEGSSFLNMKYLIAISLSALNNSEGIKKFKEIPLDYFSIFKKKTLAFEPVLKGAPTPLLITLFSRVRERLTKAILNRDYEALKIHSYDYFDMFVHMVINYAKAEHHALIQTHWEIYFKAFELTFRQNPDDLFQLYKQCFVSLKLVFNSRATLMDAIVEHMYHLVMAVIGKDIHTLVKRGSEELDPVLILEHDDPNNSRVLHFTAETNDQAIATSLAKNILSSAYFNSSFFVIKLFFLADNFSFWNFQKYPDMYDEKKLPSSYTNLDTAIMIVKSLRQILLNSFSNKEAIFEISFDGNSFEIEDFYLHYLIFNYFQLITYWLQPFETPEKTALVHQACALYQNFFPVAKGYDDDWVQKFTCKLKVTKNIKENDSKKDLNLICAIVEHMFNVFVHVCESKINDTSLTLSLVKNSKRLTHEAIKIYDSMEKINVYDYLKEFHQANIEPRVNVDFNSLTLEFSNQIELELLANLLERRSIPYKTFENIAHIYEFRMQKNKIRSLGYKLDKLLHENKENKVEPQISIIKKNDTNVPSAAVFNLEENILEDQSSSRDQNLQGKKIKKNEKKTESIRKILSEKQKNRKNKEKKEFARVSKKERVSKTIMEEEIESKQKKERSEKEELLSSPKNNSVEIIVNSVKTIYSLKDKKSRALKKDNNKSIQLLAFGDSKLLNIANNHADELKKNLNCHQQNKKSRVNLMYPILYHFIRMLNGVGLCSRQTLFAQLVDPAQALFCRNILLHRWDFCLERAHDLFLKPEKKEALIHLVINKLQLIINSCVNNRKIKDVTPIEWNDNSLYKLFKSDESLNLEKPTKLLLGIPDIIIEQIKEIGYLNKEINSPQDKFEKADVITEIKMRLVLVGDLAKEFRKNKTGDSSFFPADYSENIQKFLQVHSKNFSQFTQDLNDPYAAPLLNQLQHFLPQPDGLRLLELLEFQEFLTFCIEIRKTVGHNFLAPDFVKGIYNSYEEISNLLVGDIASVASYFMVYTKKGSEKADEKILSAIDSSEKTHTNKLT